jgi:uncharacterized protein (TIGR03437 family)
MEIRNKNGESRPINSKVLRGGQPLFTPITSCLIILWLTVTSFGRAETVTVRSGNGPVGGTDSSATFLLGPPTGVFGHAFTSTDFSGAQTGPAAFIVSPNPLWIPGLPSDPSAQWIGTNPDAGCCQGNTALYAISFQITSAFTTATLTLNWAADDGIGEAGFGPNTGVYLNGTGICGDSFPIGFGQQNTVTCNNISPLLHAGTNWLYIENTNAEGSAGLLFSATITTVTPTTGGLPVTVPGTAMPWLYSTNSGGLNYAYQFGINDGTNPVVVSASQGLDFTSNSILTVTYLSGTVSTGPEDGLPYTDANGNGLPSNNSTMDFTGTPQPSFYMNPATYPIDNGELVGTFADSSGSIVGTPFAIRNGPKNLSVPQGATQLQLGVNDDKYSDNAGFWVILVSGLPAPAKTPTITSGGILNVASYAPGPVAPGSIAAVFGSFPISSTSSASDAPWPTSLAGLSLQFADEVQAPMYYASGQQVNIQVPWELTGQTSLTATLNDRTSAPQTLTLASFAPGIFSMNGQGTGQGAVLDANYNLVDSSHPTTAGALIQIYCTGLGAVTNQPKTGYPAPTSPLAETTTTPTVTVGGATAHMLFSGLAPGGVGLYQVDALVPNGISIGASVPVFISIGGVASNNVTIAVSGPPPSPNPRPSIAALSPASAQAGSGPLTLTINGRGFISPSSVTFNGVAHTVSFDNSAQLAITLTTSDLATAGTFSVMVTNPQPGGGSSNPASFDVSPVSVPIPPVPTGLSPGSAASPGATVSTLPPTLSWNSSPGAAGYLVTLVDKAGATILSEKISTTSIVCPTLIIGVTYRWTVEAYNSSGASAEATPMYFTVVVLQTILSGTWQGTWTSSQFSGLSGVLAANLTQSGTRLTGTVLFGGSPCFVGGTVTGTVSGSALTASINLGGGQTIALSANAIATATTINGTYTLQGGSCAPNGDTGTFSLSPASVSVSSVAGSWQGTWSSSVYLGVFGSLSANLTQSEPTVTGTVSYVGSPCFTGGSLVGTMIAGVIAGNLDVGGGQTVTLSASANPTGTSLNGTYILAGGTCAPDGDAGTFSMTR